MNKIAIFGATSAIAQGAARCFAAEEAEFFLVARHAEKLEAAAADLRVRGASRVVTRLSDLNAFDQHLALVQEADSALGGIQVAIIAHGTLSDQARCEGDATLARQELDTNFVGPVSLLTHLANLLESRPGSVIAVITSVAGDRGRKKNYVYGAAKGGLGIFLQGLRNRLADKHVSVITAKPGFVSTPMTAHLRQGPLYASPSRVGRGIHDAICARKNIVYLPWFWRPIMFIIRAIPERFFKRMNL
ncbi:MAG: SDR family oxidoreductase [Candidatus Hydrogenedentota bacterium]